MPQIDCTVEVRIHPRGAAVAGPPQLAPLELKSGVAKGYTSAAHRAQAPRGALSAVRIDLASG